MFDPSIPLAGDDVIQASGNQLLDKDIQARQLYWIAHGIRNAHPETVDHVFANHREKWPQFPEIERLLPRRTEHYGLGPILKNEGTIDGTYEVIDEIFQNQFDLDASEGSTEFSQKLQLVYGDQKTVSLIQTVQKERSESLLPYSRFSWILSFPGLFHLRMNFMDMIHDLYSGQEDQALYMSTLAHNANILGRQRGRETPFHKKEALAEHAFDSRVCAFLYEEIPPRVNIDRDFDTFLKQSGPQYLLNVMENLRQKIFHTKPHLDKEDVDPTVDYELSAHTAFLQQTEVYRSLKLAIKIADIGILRQVIARCCILFLGASKQEYSNLSLYMAWLTHTNAAKPELQKAILANGLVNIRGHEDSWFEMDRLNEFFNLQMKDIMLCRRSSSLDPTRLFQNTALTASYYTVLRDTIQKAFGKQTNSYHTDRNVQHDIQVLAKTLYRYNSTQYKPGRGINGFVPIDIISIASTNLEQAVGRFNERRKYHQWMEQADEQRVIEPDDDSASGERRTEPLYNIDQYAQYYDDDDEFDPI